MHLQISTPRCDAFAMRLAKQLLRSVAPRRFSVAAGQQAAATENWQSVDLYVTLGPAHGMLYCMVAHGYGMLWHPFSGIRFAHRWTRCS